nr:hypothetical protein L204_04862 [Cryptococcus depauperatus CBS 7855]
MASHIPSHNVQVQFCVYKPMHHTAGLDQLQHSPLHETELLQSRVTFHTTCGIQTNSLPKPSQLITLIANLQSSSQPSLMTANGQGQVQRIISVIQLTFFKV